MIIGERKTLDEIMGYIKGYKKLLILGCGTCVTVCSAGGEQEVGILASQLELSNKEKGIAQEITQSTITRQCDKEFFKDVEDKINESDAILSLACGVGVNYIANLYDTPCYPGLNTISMAANIEQGQWDEMCAGCGDCILHLTGGICPVARCSKSILNGPCGGTNNGKCEINQEIDCAWYLIVEKLRKQNRLSNLEEIIPPKDWSKARDGGPRRMIREDLKIAQKEDK